LPPSSLCTGHVSSRKLRSGCLKIPPRPYAARPRSLHAPGRDDRRGGRLVHGGARRFIARIPATYSGDLCVIRPPCLVAIGPRDGTRSRPMAPDNRRSSSRSFASSSLSSWQRGANAKSTLCERRSVSWILRPMTALCHLISATSPRRRRPSCFPGGSRSQRYLALGWR
jgi:hypothetical protein